MSAGDYSPGGYALLACFLLLSAPFVLARAVEVWQGHYEEPTHSGATPECPECIAPTPAAI